MPKRVVAFWALLEPLYPTTLLGATRELGGHEWSGHPGLVSKPGKMWGITCYLMGISGHFRSKNKKNIIRQILETLWPIFLSFSWHICVNKKFISSDIFLDQFEGPKPPNSMISRFLSLEIRHLWT